MGVEFFKKVFKLKSAGYPFGEMLTPLVIFGKGLGLWICEEQIPFPALSVVYGELFFYAISPQAFTVMLFFGVTVCS